MPEPKWGIVPLEGKYCRSCVQSLRDFRMHKYEIVPMCREDLDQFLRNGDIEIVRKLMKKWEERMLDNFKAENLEDEKGNPAGGTVRGTGLSIDWQNGPLGRGADRQAPNGAFVETVIAAAKQRIEYYQGADGRGKFSCRENAIAITKLDEALLWLNKRTADREARAVEGTHAR